jgi:hypothetical protein
MISVTVAPVPARRRAACLACLLAGVVAVLAGAEDALAGADGGLAGACRAVLACPDVLDAQAAPGVRDAAATKVAARMRRMRAP